MNFSNPLFPVVGLLVVLLLAAVAVAAWATRRTQQLQEALEFQLEKAQRSPEPTPEELGTRETLPLDGAPAAPEDPKDPEPTPELGPAPEEEDVPPGEIPRWARECLEGHLPGRYQDFSLIGSGAMATVIRARDEQLGRLVAIKIPPPHLSTHPEFHTRFMREAMALARLDHEHIARIYDVPDVPEGEAPMMIMECLEGEDLDQLLTRQGPVHPVRLVPWMEQAADALDYIHAKGITHRDVKPANLFLVGEEDLKLVDFGLVSIRDASLLTRSGVRVGSPAYMSPEQLRGEPVGPPADQFALAATFFELLSGELPYTSKDRFRLQPPSLQERCPDLPEAVDPVLARAFAVQADNRYPNLTLFVEELVAALGY